MLPARLIDHRIEAGCDEAGRGPLAGPVVAAAVILPPQFVHPWLNDSKKLSAARRETLRDIIEREAVAWAVAFVSPVVIDRINILQASFLAMHHAIGRLKTAPEMLLIDGNRFANKTAYPHLCIVKGDGKVGSIAAASILAKTHRDAFMQKLHERYPAYGWNKNAGYPTAMHRAALAAEGPSPHHRLSFGSSPPQLPFAD